MKTLFTLPPCSELIAFADVASLSAYMSSRPHALHVASLPGVRSRPGEIKALVAHYASPAERDMAQAELRNVESLARREYTRAMNLCMAQKRLTAQLPSRDAGLI